MPDGEMRRPPQLWEQKLSRITSILGVGISSSGDATSIVNPSPPPGSDGPGTDPGPTLPPPGAFIKPSTPTLTGAVQGIRVNWDGLNADGDLWPYDTSWIEVHMDTSGTAFTPGSATLKGRLDYPGEFYVGGLSAGTTYHFRLRGADPAGNYTEASNAASGQTGLTTSGDYGTATIAQGAVSFNARQIGGVTSTVGTVQPTAPVVGDIWLDTTGGATTHKRWNGTTWETILFGSGSIADLAITTVKIDQSAITEAKLSSNAVTAGKIAAGAISADKIAANAITADKIAANAITSDKIAANTITASNIAANTITSSLIAANTITATNIATGAITAGAIAAGAITAGKIAADAIDAMTITGATVRTAGSGARVVFNSGGITGYDALDNARFTLNASTGDATITGNFRTSPSGARVEMGDAFGVLSTVNVYGNSGLVGASGVSLDGDYRVAAVAGYDLELAGDVIDVQSTLQCAGTATATTFRPEGNLIVFQGYRTTTTTSDVVLRLKSNVTATDTAHFEVKANGDADNTNNSYGGLSDATLKENVTPARDYLDDLRDVDIVNFNFVGSDVKLLGVTAQQLQTVFPSMVAADEDGRLSVKYSVFVPMLITAVQSLADKVDELTARIEALEA